MSKIKDVKSPVITTLSVEVMVLRIGKKQCTISVFNQLPVESFNIENFKEVSLWGIVRHKYLWVVYQRGDILMKAVMPQKDGFVPAKDIVHFLREELQSLLSKLSENIYSDEFKKETGLQEGMMDYDKEKGKKIRKYYVAYQKKAIEFLDTHEAISPLREDIEKRKKLQEEWLNFINKCQGLSQLFIAV